MQRRTWTPLHKRALQNRLRGIHSRQRRSRPQAPPQLHFRRRCEREGGSCPFVHVSSWIPHHLHVSGSIRGHRHLPALSALSPPLSSAVWSWGTPGESSAGSAGHVARSLPSPRGNRPERGAQAAGCLGAQGRSRFRARPLRCVWVSRDLSSRQRGLWSSGLRPTPLQNMGVPWPHPSVGRLGPADGQKRVRGCVGPRSRREVRAEPV